MKLERGFTVTEMLVGMLLTLLLALGFFSFIENIVRIKLRERALTAVSVELGVLRKKLSRPNFCTSILAGHAFAPPATQPINPGAVTAMDFTINPMDNLTLMSTELQSTGRLETLPMGPGVTYELHKANLLFRFETSIETLGGRTLRNRTVPLRVLVNITTNTIVNCQGDAGGDGEYCSLIGGTYDTTKLPPCQLPVYTLTCAAGMVADGITPGGFNCINPPNPPVGPPVGPPPWNPGPVYLVTQSFPCSPASCSCPPQFPLYIMGGLPAVTVICGGYQSIPPAQTYANVMACLAIANGAGFMNNCVTLAGSTIQSGFGPCYACP